MDAMRFPTVVSAAGGVATHFIFNRYEPRGRFSMLSLVLGPPTVISVLLLAFNSGSAIAIIRSFAIHIGSLIASVVAYRLSPYHPLASFPGPVVCRITRLWAFYIAYGEKQHQYYKYLHDRYGTHVRTGKEGFAQYFDEYLNDGPGPNHIHINDASALPTVMGIKHFRRSDRYSIGRVPGTSGSLLTIIDHQEHAQRRKTWERSLNTQAVLGYRDLLYARIGQLIGQLEKREGKEVNLSSWLSYLSFDFMGDLAFGGSFHLLKDGCDVEGYTDLIRKNGRYDEVAGTIHWITPFLPLLPGIDRRHRLRSFSVASVRARMALGSSRKDIFYYLLDEEGIGQGPPSLPTLMLEAGLTIGAGSDTTGTTLTNLFFYLMSNSEIYARLRKEVDSVFPRGSDVSSFPATVDLKLLNAVINETLRLQPVVPGGVQRFLPPGSGGVDVARRWIPEETTVQISPYIVHRNPQYFYPDPERFCPDRWLETASQSRLDQSAYFPFSFGPTGCVGKGLALQELRMVACALIQKFEFQFAPRFKPEEWEDSLKDCFILVKGELPVRVQVRK